MSRIRNAFIVIATAAALIGGPALAVTSATGTAAVSPNAVIMHG